MNEDLLDFIQASPTAFHATQEIKTRLVARGFKLLYEGDAWQLQAGQSYVLTRNDSSIIAFRYGDEDICQQGIRLIGAHTDSPCLKVKPNPDIYKNNYWQLGVEVYGGVLLNPWFDRELSLAGKVSYINADGDLSYALINMLDAIGMIPSLAIHLDRAANDKRSINAQKDLPVIIKCLNKDEKPVFKAWILSHLNKEHPNAQATKILDYELSFYDVTPGRTYGAANDFIAASRLDNLLSCYVGMQALIDADSAQSCLFVCNDHEEVGSASAAGAQGPMLQHFLQRVLPQHENYARAIEHSMLLSVDNAHGVHPNYSDKHDANHGPLLNSGPVIKINANQRYASNTETQSRFRALCERHQIPMQAFVVRSDMGCGSTIGPIAATELGVKTLDIGVPTFSMHSIRETAGSKDINFLYQALKAFLVE